MQRMVQTQSAGSTYTDKPIPNAFWRAFATFLYLVPTLDLWSLGLRTYGHFPQTMIVFHIASKFVRFYYAHQFVPLIVFFFMFLAIIKNKRLHHFVRFNGMQAMMLDILVMLPTISNNYIPGEIFWTVLGKFITSTCFITVFVAIAYCVVFTMAGKYADIPLVSDACYMQVYQIEFL